MDSVSAFPLSWPIGWKRSVRPASSKFKSSFAKGRDEVVNQLRLMGATGVVLSMNIPLKQDGLPYANVSTPRDAGVAVYFTYKEKQMVFACDKWVKVEDNLWSVNKTIEAIRGIERWGASEMLERAFTGFAQLEAPKTEDCWTILGVRPGATEDEIKAAWKTKARTAHPDVGGSNELMTKVNSAYAQAMAAR